MHLFNQRDYVEVTRQSMIEGIKAVRPGATTGDIGAAIQEYAEANKYSVVREYCGHGIGKKFQRSTNTSLWKKKYRCQIRRRYDIHH